MIIGINGYAGSGKDTVGVIIQYLTSSYKPCAIEDCLKTNQDFSRYTDWEIKKWAGKLKTIASLLTGIPTEKFEDQEFKKTYLRDPWSEKGYDVATGKYWLRPMTVREFLQKLGTDALRTGLHTNTWVNALMSDYYIKKCDCPTECRCKFDIHNWIITDTRFPNEAQAIKDVGGLVIRVDRPGVKPINDHPSEIGLDDWNFDYKIANVSDLKALTATVEGILKKENIL